MRHKKLIATSINEFLQLEEDREKLRQKEVDLILVDAFEKAYKSKAFALLHKERRMYLFIEQIPEECRRIAGFDEKITNFVNQYNEHLTRYTDEEMKNAKLLEAFVYLVEPIIKKIEYKNV